MKDSLIIYQYGSNSFPIPDLEDLSPRNFITFSIETSPIASSSSSDSLSSTFFHFVDPVMSISPSRLQERIEHLVTALIEEQGHQVFYGEHYHFLGQWLHADSSNIP